MSDTLRSYEVLAVSGGWVDGKRYPIGATVVLSDADARYERDQGNIRLVGTATVSPPPVLTLGDKLTVNRNGVPVIVSIADLTAFLASLGLGGGITTPPVADTSAGSLLPLGLF